MDTIETKPQNRIKRFVNNHRVAITVTATSLVWIAVNRLNAKAHDDFLKEKGLYDEFYTPSEDEM